MMKSAITFCLVIRREDIVVAVSTIYWQIFGIFQYSLPTLKGYRYLAEEPS